MSQSGTDDGSDARVDGSPGTSRRQFVAGAGALGLVAGTGGVLAACGGSSKSGTSGSSTPSTTATNAAAQELRQGGKITIGLSDGSTADSLDGHVAKSLFADAARQAAIYDQLAESRGALKKIAPTLQLAEEMTPNKDATEWTIRLRSDVEFHNGKTLDVDDLIYTIKRISDPKVGANGFARAVLIDIKKAKKLDNRTLRVPLVKPVAILEDLWANGTVMSIVPVGYDPKKPVGTGPFTVKSFSAGQQTVLERFPNYWGEKAKLDELVLIELPDNTARYNSLQSGQIDVMDSIPPEQVATVKGNASYHVSSVPTAQMYPIYMRVDTAPFDDVRVRQAIRLSIDRKQIVQAAYAGNATAANDIFSQFADPLSDTGLVRERDVEQAKSLLKQAGKSGVTATLVCARIGAGTLETCQIIAENAREAGINLKLKQVDAGTVFGPNYLKWPFSIDSWPGALYLITATNTLGPDAHLNETHFRNTRYNSLYNQAVAEVDPGKRGDLVHELQKIDFEQGGYLIPIFANYTAAYSTKVGGYYPANLTGVTVSAGFFTKLGLVK